MDPKGCTSLLTKKMLHFTQYDYGDILYVPVELVRYAPVELENVWYDENPVGIVLSNTTKVPVELVRYAPVELENVW